MATALQAMAKQFLRLVRQRRAINRPQ